MATFHCNRYPQLVVKFSDRSRVRFDRKRVEVDGELAERLDAFARQHPEYEIERVADDEADEKPLTPKQQAVARAEALGLDTSGSKADIEARIAAHEANSETEDESDADPEDDSEDADSDENADDEPSDDDSADDEDSEDDSDENQSGDA